MTDTHQHSPTHLHTSLRGFSHGALVIQRLSHLLCSFRRGCSAALADNILDWQAEGAALHTQADAGLGTVVAQQILQQDRR